MTDTTKLPVPPWVVVPTGYGYCDIYDAEENLIAENLGQKTAEFIVQVCNDALLGKLR